MFFLRTIIIFYLSIIFLNLSSREENIEIGSLLNEKTIIKENKNSPVFSTVFVSGYIWAHIFLQFSLIFSFFGFFIFFQYLFQYFFAESKSYLLRDLTKNLMNIEFLAPLYSAIFFFLFMISYTILSVIFGEKGFFKKIIIHALNFSLTSFLVLSFLYDEELYDNLKYLFYQGIHFITIMTDTINRDIDLPFTSIETIIVLGYLQFFLYKLTKHIIKLKDENWSEPEPNHPLKSVFIEVTSPSP